MSDLIAKLEALEAKSYEVGSGWPEASRLGERERRERDNSARQDGACQPLKELCTCWGRLYYRVRPIWEHFVGVPGDHLPSHGPSLPRQGVSPASEGTTSGKPGGAR